MGAAHSNPPPLIKVNAPGGKVLVPPGTAFTVQPPSYSRSRSDPYARGPVYQPCPPPRRGTRSRRPHYNGADIDFLEDSENSETTLTETMEGTSPRGMRRQGSKGYPGGMGGMMGGIGRRAGPGYFDGDARPRSAPEMPLGTYPGMGMGSPRIGMGGINGMGGMGPPGMGGMGGMGPGATGGMGGMPPSGMPPEYTSNPSVPRFGGGLGVGGMPGPAMNPYASYPGPPPSLLSDTTASPPQQKPRASKRPPGHYERVPMGVYADAEKPRKPSRSRTEPQTSAQLNRGQSSGRKVGPSGKEWLDGDAFLDACVCTTGCKCRKSHRVLYRSRDNHGRGGGSDDDSPEYHSGEIRYILRDDLGRDCGDHSGCKKSESDSEEEEGKSKKSKDKKEEKQRKQQFEGIKEELLEALDERFQDMKKEGMQRGKPEGPSRSPFGGHGMGQSPFMMDESAMDPRMAQQMGMAMDGDPYSMGMPGIGRMPLGMPDPMGKRPMRRPGMPMGGMTGVGMSFEDELSMVDMDGMGPMGMGNHYMPPGMMNKRSMRPDYMSPRRAKAAGRFGAGGMDMDMDPRAVYSRAMKGRGGMMGSRRQGGGAQRPHVDFGSDDFDIGPSRRAGMGRREGEEDQAAFGGMSGGDEDGEFPATRRHATSPASRRNGGRASLNRVRLPRADTDDEDAY